MLRWTGIVSLAVLALFTAAGTAQDQPAAAKATSSLAAQASAAAKNFDPLAAPRYALATSMKDLDALLKKTLAAKADGWKRFLRWSELEALASATGAAPPNAETISQVTGKSRTARAGLTRPEHAQFGQSLERLEQALDKFTTATSDSAAAATEFGAKMAELSTNLEKYQSDPAAGDAALAIGRTLGWLEENRQAPELVSATRREFGRPNFFGYASKQFAAASVNRNIDQVMPVSDNILGTSLHGTARMVGRTELVLNENPNMASMNVVLRGNAWSNSTGYNGPVTLHTSGVTSISAQKLVTMTAEGLRTYSAQAAACTNSKIHDICARLRIVENIAWKRAGQQKGQAEQIGSQHAAARVAGQLNQEVGRPVAAQDKRYQEKVRQRLLDKGEFPEEALFSSTRERLQLRMRQESPNLLAAPNEPPTFAGDHDLAARAHESSITNFGQGLLRNYYLNDFELERIIRDDLEMDVPEELRVTRPDGSIDIEKEPWAIRFADVLPVQAKFSNGTIVMTVRAGEFYSGQPEPNGPYRRVLSELIEISATYQIVKTEQGATLKRVGDISVEFPNARAGTQSSARAIARGRLRTKFDKLFKDEFVGSGLKFKGELAKAGTLTLKEIQADKAWIVLGWDMPPPAVESTAAAAE